MAIHPTQEQEMKSKLTSDELSANVPDMVMGNAVRFAATRTDDELAADLGFYSRVLASKWQRGPSFDLRLWRALAGYGATVAEMETR
jgi:hypothetical protein